MATMTSRSDEHDELHQGNGGTRRVPDPGPLLIWWRCRKIQKTWTEEDRQRRRDGGVEHGKPRWHWRT
jgi:hypothetical protein